MKIIDYAIIFVIILMPMVLAVSIQINAQIKAENVEAYYKNLIDSAVSDASQEMKELENDDIEIDYGYDSEESKKVSINAEHAINTFLNSLYYNLGINGNKQAEELLLNYIPAVLILDYNGMHMYSMESYQYRDKNGEMQTVTEHVLKPKKYYSYSYDIEKYCEDGGQSIYNCDSKKVKARIVDGDKYTVIFTLSDYITFVEKSESGDYTTYSRYAKDMFDKLFPADIIFDNRYSPNKVELDERQNELLFLLNDKKKDLIINMVTNELSYAISTHNSFAKSLGIEYDFQFTKDIAEDWYSTVQDIGVMSFVQGIALGNNQYLNHYAFGGGDLNYTPRYLVTHGTQELIGYDKLYHKSTECEIYKSSQAKKDLKPLYYSSKYKAASAGFYPCPVCISLKSSIDSGKYVEPKLKIEGPYLTLDPDNKKINRVTAGESVKFVLTYEKGSDDLSISLDKNKIILNNFGGGIRIEEIEPDAGGNRRFNIFVDGITKYEIVNDTYVEIGGNSSPKYITVLGTSATDKKGKNPATLDSSSFLIDDIRSDPAILITGPDKTSVAVNDSLTYKVKYVKGYSNIASIDLNASKISFVGFRANVNITKSNTEENTYNVILSNIVNTDYSKTLKYITILGDSVMDSAGQKAITTNSGTFKITDEPPQITIEGPYTKNTIRKGESLYYDITFAEGSNAISTVTLDEDSIILYGFTASLNISNLGGNKYRVTVYNVQGESGAGKYIRITEASVIDVKGIRPNSYKNSGNFGLVD